MKQAARYDDIDDLISLASSGISLDSKDSQGRTGDDLKFMSHQFLLITQSDWTAIDFAWFHVTKKKKRKLEEYTHTKQVAIICIRTIIEPSFRL